MNWHKNTLTIFAGICSLLFLNVQLQAQHTHPDNCPSCRNMKEQMWKAYQQWGFEKTLNINYNDRSDTIDILHYHLDLTFDNYAPGAIHGSCNIQFTPKMNSVNQITLDLLTMQVDSIKMNNTNLSYTHNDTMIHAQFPAAMNVGDTANVVIYYQGNPQSDAMWGGFYFQNGYGFNLGVGFDANPHNYGRVWYPCFDNFVERATYSFKITTPQTKPAYCNGYLVKDTTFGAFRTREWQMDSPIPTYLSCVASAEYVTASQLFNGIQGTVPVELVAKASDTSDMKGSFQNLDKAFAAYEYWFGPFRWNKVGFSAVPFNAGAMEHATNIAYPASTLDGNLQFETLMAHELSHHWWGDLATCETAEDMWINEGLASYCEHLFLEYTYGRNRYISEVKSNHYSVVQGAHASEGGYLPVSGVPHEYTYGTHVYDKGASMGHNLRWYLGDSLFRVGMTAVLDSFKFKSINSFQMRDYLTQVTGVDLTDFFNDWIFNGGFSHFEIDSIDIQPTPGLTDVTVQVKQKLLGATQFHNSTPIQFTFMDENWNKHQEVRLVSGEFDVQTFQLPFEPTTYFLNEDHGLNQGRMDFQKKFYTTGQSSLSYVRMDNFTVMSISDSAFVHMEYHPLPPDPFINNPYNYQLSTSRYWTVNGVWDTTFNAEFRLEPNTGLDNDLMATTGLDSIILLYRPTPNDEWREHPDYIKFQLGGFGYLKVNTILKGDYAFGNGQMGLGVSNRIIKKSPLKSSQVYPVPAKDQLTIELQLKKPVALSFELYDVQGRLVQQEPQQRFSGRERFQLTLEVPAAGHYFLKIRTADGDLLATHKVVVR